MGLPWTGTHLAPFGFLSPYDFPVLPNALPLRHLRFLGYPFHSLLLRVAKDATGSWVEPYRHLRSELGLPAAGNPIFDSADAGDLTLALFSKELGRKMPDWPKRAVVTVFPFYDDDRAYLFPEVLRFLNAGEPPLIFTLGTSAVLGAQHFYVDSAKAAQELGRRAILLVGNEATNVPRDLPSTILAEQYEPFSLLFLRGAAIVHQGGVGTTGQAMRSGKPMLVVPYVVDQPDNAERVRRIGVARVIARTRYSARSAAQELDSLLRQPSYQRSAKSVATSIAAEHGARASCDPLVQLAG